MYESMNFIYLNEELNELNEELNVGKIMTFK